MKGKSSIRITIVVLVGLALAGTLAACKAPTPAAETTGLTTATVETTAATSTKAEEAKPVKIIHWTLIQGDKPDEEKAWEKEVADAYTKEHPNVTVEWVEKNLDTFLQEFDAAVKAGEGPDIMYFWEGMWLLEHVWRNELAPISDYWSQEDFANWIPFKEPLSYDGKIWAVPSGMTLVTWAYNKDLFKKAGLDPEKPPQTWEELVNACKQLKNAGITPIGFGLKDKWGMGWFLGCMYSQTLSGPKMMLEAVVGERKWTDPEFAEFWRKLDEIKPYFNDDVLSVDLFPSQDIFVAGKCAMTVGLNAWVESWVEKMGADKVGVFKFPVYGTAPDAEGFNVQNSGVFAIPQYSPNKEIAADYLKFVFNNPQWVEKYYEAARVAPAIKGVSLDIFKTAQGKQLYEWALSKPAPYYESYMPSAFESEAFFDNGQLYFAGELNVEAAIAKMEDAIKKWRDSSPEMLENVKKWKDSL